MKKITTVLAAGAMVLGASTSAFAQNTAIETATKASVCGDVAPLSARYLASGQLEVTCPSGSVAQNAFGGTGLTPTTAGVAIGALIVLAILVGNDGDGSSSSTTTTTTSTTTN